MKVLFAIVPMLLLVGCASGPSPEERNREADVARAAARDQAEFRKGLPPESMDEQPLR